MWVVQSHFYFFTDTVPLPGMQFSMFRVGKFLLSSNVHFKCQLIFEAFTEISRVERLQSSLRSSPVAHITLCLSKPKISVLSPLLWDAFRLRRQISALLCNRYVTVDKSQPLMPRSPSSAEGCSLTFSPGLLWGWKWANPIYPHSCDLVHSMNLASKSSCYSQNLRIVAH